MRTCKSIYSNTTTTPIGYEPQINDIVIQGYIVSYDEGSAKDRMLIGFGSGASNVKAAAEGFQVTAQGLRKLGGGKTDAG